MCCYGSEKEWEGCGEVGGWEGMRRMERHWRKAYGKAMDGQVVLHTGVFREIYLGYCEDDDCLYFAVARGHDENKCCLCLL